MQGPFYLAPMEAVNCASFRVLCKRRGAALVFTDMIDADVFAQCAAKEGKEKAVAKYINPQSEEQPLAIQLGGSNIDALTYTSNAVQQHAHIIDFNVGCPLPYMLGKKGGVYLQKHPEQLFKIIRSMRNTITTKFSVKIRAGWDKDSINAQEVAVQLQELGIDMLTIHPRTRKQLYTDRADWQLARKVKQAISIPLCLSGDVTNAYMAHRAFEHVKCDAIMVGRGAKHNPSVFSQLQTYWKTKQEPTRPDGLYEKNKKDALADFEEFLYLYKEREHRYRFSELQDHARWTARGCKNNTIVTKQIAEAKDEGTLLRIIRAIQF